MRTFIIEGEEVDIEEEEIKLFSLIYEECYYQEGGRDVEYSGELYFSENGEILDREDNKKIVPEVLTTDEGELIHFNRETFLLECTEGFVLDNKLYLIAELEEVI